MTIGDSMESIAEHVARHAAWHVWVLEYGITHHRMVLALHLGAYPKAAKLELVGCVFLSGALQAGPYQLLLAEVDYQGERHWEMRSTDGSFHVVFGSARLVRELPG